MICVKIQGYGGCRERAKLKRLRSDMYRIYAYFFFGIPSSLPSCVSCLPVLASFSRITFIWFLPMHFGTFVLVLSTHFITKWCSDFYTSFLCPTKIATLLLTGIFWAHVPMHFRSNSFDLVTRITHLMLNALIFILNTRVFVILSLFSLPL